jgi:hypothetical protein
MKYIIFGTGVHLKEKVVTGPKKAINTLQVPSLPSESIFSLNKFNK